MKSWQMKFLSKMSQNIILSFVRLFIIKLFQHFQMMFKNAIKNDYKLFIIWTRKKTKYRWNYRNIEKWFFIVVKCCRWKNIYDYVDYIDDFLSSSDLDKVGQEHERACLDVENEPKIKGMQAKNHMNDNEKDVVENIEFLAKKHIKGNDTGNI